MATNNEELTWCTVFRIDKHDDWLFPELQAGRLRQGWGKPGCAIRTADGPVEKTTFEKGYKKAFKKEPSARRFDILTGMLYLNSGDVVVVPNMPVWRKQFTIARVSEGYEFGTGSNLEDYRHIVHVDPDSVRTFDYHADEDAFRISGLFARANHREAITFFYDPEQIAAVLRLMERPSNLTPQSHEVFFRAAIDGAFRTAAIALQDQLKDWNGNRFEAAVWQTFRDQGYTMIEHQRFDRQGGNADILLSPLATPYGVFLPGETAVQVKCKQGADIEDKKAISQIVTWAESQGSDAMKCVISSASGFTWESHKFAADEDVMLIGALQTMCFLLGVADRYRDDWDSGP